jgi:hypothetical protein
MRRMAMRRPSSLKTMLSWGCAWRGSVGEAAGVGVDALLGAAEDARAIARRGELEGEAVAEATALDFEFEAARAHVQRLLDEDAMGAVGEQMSLGTADHPKVIVLGGAAETGVPAESCILVNGAEAAAIKERADGAGIHLRAEAEVVILQDAPGELGIREGRAAREQDDEGNVEGAGGAVLIRPRVEEDDGTEAGAMLDGTQAEVDLFVHGGTAEELVGEFGGEEPFGGDKALVDAARTQSIVAVGFRIAVKRPRINGADGDRDGA